MMVPTKRGFVSSSSSPSSSSSSSVEVAEPHKKLKLSTTGTKSVTNSSSSRKRKKIHPVPDVASSKSPLANKNTTPDWLPDGWTVAVLAKPTGQNYKVYKETATGKKFYSKPQVLNYLGICSSSKTQVSEIPKPLYDLIQYAARARKSLKLNSNNGFAKRKLKYYEPKILHLAKFYRCASELPSDWKYDPETSFMANVSKPPPSPPKPKPKPKPKMKKKKIKITWSSPNYHGRYPLNNDEHKVWNKFTINDKTKANSAMCHPIKKNLVTVEDDMIVDLLGKFALDTFNKSCHLYVNREEDNMVSGAEFMECKFYKLTKEYIFYLTIEAIERGIPGVYTTQVECKTKNGAKTLLNFDLTDRKPKWHRPWVKPQLESHVEYETLGDGSSDPHDFYKLTGMVHRETMCVDGGFDYHNPPFSAHLMIYNTSKDKKAREFEPNISRLSEFLVAAKTILAGR